MRRKPEQKYTKELAAQKEEYEKQMKDKDKRYDILKALKDSKEKHMSDVCLKRVKI